MALSIIPVKKLSSAGHAASTLWCNNTPLRLVIGVSSWTSTHCHGLGLCLSLVTGPFHILLPKKMTKIFYALRHIKSRLYLEVSISNGDTYYGPDYQLWSGEEDVMKAWHTDDPIAAATVRRYPPSWYNSSATIPRHSYKSEELEIVEVMVEVQERVIDFTLPEPIEYLDRKAVLTPKDKAHYEYAKKDADDMVLSYWDLKELFEREKKHG